MRSNNKNPPPHITKYQFYTIVCNTYSSLWKLLKMRIFNKSGRCMNLSRYSVSDIGANNTSEWRHRVLRRTIPYCTSATKAGVWLAIFIPSSAALSPFLFPLRASLTLDSHRFATLLPYPSCGLATKQPPCDTPQGKTALMCISANRRKQARKKEKRKKKKRK